MRLKNTARPTTLALLACGWVFLALLAAPPARGERPAVRFVFREPAPTAYWIELPPGPVALTAQPPPPVRSLAAARENAPENTVQFSTHLVLHLAAHTPPARFIANRPLTVLREAAPGLFVLAAPDAWTALREAQRLAQHADVLASYPVATRPRRATGTYFRKPSDPYFQNQWHLENRGFDGASLGADLNVRAAWPFARGRGVTIAIADDGIEFTHPDLAANLTNSLHFNFSANQPGGAHTAPAQGHGTCVAGLAGAVGENGLGVSGVAPESQLTSWCVLDPPANDEGFAAMFHYRSNLVSVQNHSWGFSTDGLSGPSLLEQVAISNAVQFGRGGLGVVMVHAAGNARDTTRDGNFPGVTDANEDGYVSNPDIITVAAVRTTGRVASYSNPGACVLVAAPSGDSGFPLLFTTDRAGLLGFNRIETTNDLSSYTAGGGGFSGTSGATPLVAGVAALILSANPNLARRDVQQILIHSARHVDLADPGLTTNAAGFVVSHNTGFGVPDAGVAVRLARLWSNRPPVTVVTVTAPNRVPIPEPAFLVVATGVGVPANLATIAATIPGESFHPDDAPGENLHPTTATPDRPAVFVGQATNTLTTNLTGTAALIQRGGAFFTDKLQRAEAAGAALTVIYNNTNDTLLSMAIEGYFPRRPAAFIGRTAGEALVAQAQTNATLRLRLQENPATISFAVTNQLLCEHVGVRVQTDHPHRGDLRLVLLSPHGTRSILQRMNPFNSATEAGPADWTYYSTHHFYEAAAGTWQLLITDEIAGDTGNVLSASLSLRGVAIVDTDGDGLDDRWEMEHLKSLASGSRDDPDGDGYSNLREQILGTDPLSPNSPEPFRLDLSVWNENLVRLSWPSAPGQTNALQLGALISGQLAPATNVVTRFPETEVFLSYTNLLQRFFRLQRPAVP